MKRALIIGGTSGIGAAIYKNIKPLCKETIKTGKKEIDTTSLKSVNNFTTNFRNKEFDIIVLNTGGPPDLKFENISNENWLENFNKLFLSFVNIIKKLKIKKNGYIFLISSYIVKEPEESLIISSSLRVGFVSLFKSLSKIYSGQKISFINLAPGPIKTKRLKNLLKNEKESLASFSKSMPHGLIPNPNELGLFVKFVVENKIKSFNGVTIPFDSGLLKGL